MTRICGHSADGIAPARLSVGEECLVRLPSNPTTGYRWELQAVIAAGVVEQVGQAEFQPAPDDTGPPRVGAGSAQVFRLRAVGVGDATLHFVYRRAWEPVQTPAVNQHELVLMVR
jgi:inhibitor of cysteine peptidase